MMISLSPEAGLFWKSHGFLLTAAVLEGWGVFQHLTRHHTVSEYRHSSPSRKQRCSDDWLWVLHCQDVARCAPGQQVSMFVSGKTAFSCGSESDQAFDSGTTAGASPLFGLTDYQ